MTRNGKVWLEFAGTCAVSLILDVMVFAAAYLGAFILRFNFGEPQWGWRGVATSFVIAGIVGILSLALVGGYRLAWRRIALADIPRFAFASLLYLMTLLVLRAILSETAYVSLRPPYSIAVISMFLSFIGLVGWRLTWSTYSRARLRDLNLLDRDIRTMDRSAALRFIQGKVVAVTGAGGTIGSELVRQVALAAPKQLLLVENGEHALYQIDRELRETGVQTPVVPLLVDITDLERMDEVFSLYRPDIVLHAAAYKHVPMVEMNPREGWRNNAQGTENLAKLALRHAVSRFVLISTDKAVNPVSVMGKTKRAAEEAIMALNSDDAPTSFCAVRFGNVLGSSGSVVPLFREQIAKRHPVTVTHPDMKRYFMTVREAVGLVLQAASRSEKAIYTLDMGEPVRILDLAEQMIRQAGYKPYVDIPIVFTGIRPGEKLFEELDVSEKSCYCTDMARIFVTKPSCGPTAR